jgi:hypothetical protein
MNVGGIPFSNSPKGFWVVGSLILAAFAFVAIGLLQLRFFRGRVSGGRAGVSADRSSSTTGTEDSARVEDLPITTSH